MDELKEYLKLWIKKYPDILSDDMEIDKDIKKEKYYTKKKETILRNKILWNLNHNFVKKPRKETINNYNLKYDHNSKKWF